jgi:YidC/Oxa1 family membrane protein insertase
MDSGRFLLAVVLMIALVVVTNIIFPPVRPAPGVPGDSIIAGGDTTPAALPRDTSVPARPPAPPVPAPADSGAAGQPAPARTIAVESELFRYSFSSRGASITGAELKQYESGTRPGEEVELAPEGAPLISFALRLGDRTIDLSTAPIASEPAAVDGLAPDTVRLAYTDPESGARIDFSYGISPDEYLVDVRAAVSGAAERPQLLIRFAPTLRSNEAEPREDESALAYVINSDDRGIQSVPLRDVEAERIEEGPLVWAALKNKYFLAAAIPAATTPTPFGGLIVRPTGQPNTADLAATLLADAQGQLAFRLYLGPREADRLTRIGYDLRDVSPFGWRAFQPILRPLGHAIQWALTGLHTALGIGYGWVLILFGFLVRIVLWPLNNKAMRAQMKNMEMQPRLKEIQARYKADPERLQKEMLKLYREEGFNPMGGCLPLLMPFPILIALFFVFQSTIEFRGVPFLWLPDLSRKDPYYILPVLLGLSMFALQWLSMRSTKDANPQMKFMMYFMPLFMTVLFLNFASGLNLYYAAMNVASVPQQLQIINERKRRQARASP